MNHGSAMTSPGIPLETGIISQILVWIKHGLYGLIVLCAVKTKHSSSVTNVNPARTLLGIKSLSSVALVTSSNC